MNHVLLRLVMSLAMGSAGLTAQPVVSFSAVPTQGTLPLTVSLQGQITGATPIAWLWNFGTGLPAVTQTPTVTFASLGQFDVKLTVITATGFFQHTELDFITVLPTTLKPDFSAAKHIGRPPLLVQFTDLTSGTAPTAWLWNFGDGSTNDVADPIHRYDLPGTYDVQLTVSLPGSTASMTKQGLVTVEPADISPDFTAENARGLAPLTTSFEGRSLDANVESWAWDFGDGSTGSGQHVAHTYLAPGRFDVSLSAFVGQQFHTVTQQDAVNVGPFGGIYLETDLVKPVADAFNNFGPALAVSGRIAVVEQQDSGPWTEVAKLTGRVGIPYQAFGQAVGLWGDTLVVSATTGTPGLPAGLIHVFERRSDGHWVEIQQFTGSDTQPGDRFGEALSLGDGRLLVGAELVTAPLKPGAAYLFERQPSGVWAEVAILTASDAGSNDRFGGAVSLSGNLALVGARGHDHGINSSGSAYIYARQTDGSWPEIAELRASEPGTSDTFGASLGLTEKLAVVTAIGDDGEGTPPLLSTGAAYVFQRQDDVRWVEVAKLHSSLLGNSLLQGLGAALGPNGILVTGFGKKTGPKVEGLLHSFEPVNANGSPASSSLVLELVRLGLPLPNSSAPRPAKKAVLAIRGAPPLATVFVVALTDHPSAGILSPGDNSSGWLPGVD